MLDLLREGRVRGNHLSAVPLQEVVDRWQGIFPRARTVRCEAAGHFVAEEEPEVFSAELERFLDEVVDRPHDADGAQPERRPTD